MTTEPGGPALNLRAVYTTKDGPVFSLGDVTTGMMEAIHNRELFKMTPFAKDNPDDIAEIAKRLDQATEAFERSRQRFIDLVNETDFSIKKATAGMKQSSDAMAGSLSRVEKAANFDRLERYVTLLERTAAAMATLAEIEKSGKLEKISSALR